MIIMTHRSCVSGVPAAVKTCESCQPTGSLQEEKTAAFGV